MSEKSYLRLLDTVADERSLNILYCKDQLRKLHQGLFASKIELIDAIVADTDHTKAEALAEVFVTASAIKTCFDSLILKISLEEEYRIQRGLDAVDSRRPVGIVYIEPTSRTLTYSVLSTVATAIAGGNCVAIVLEQNLRRSTGIVRAVLSKLDPDLIDVLPTKMQDDGFLSQCKQVIQVDNSSPPRSNSLASPTSAKAIAIVDRAADIAKAAKELVDARFQFGGDSPYSPDLVLVNEFVKKDFLRATAQYAVEYSAASSNGRAHITAESQRKPRMGEQGQEVKGANVIAAGYRGSVLGIISRKTLDQMPKITSRELYVHPVRSLDDAIDLANKTTGNDKALAAYVFGAPAACKYLSQFVQTQITFANGIHREYLLGPAAPSSIRSSGALRYSIDAFTVPKPALITESSTSVSLKEILARGSKVVSNEVVVEMLKETDLDKDRPVRHQIGFFEQGILTGLAMAVTPIVVGVSTLGYYGVHRFMAWSRTN